MNEKLLSGHSREKSKSDNIILPRDLLKDYSQIPERQMQNQALVLSENDIQNMPPMNQLKKFKNLTQYSHFFWNLFIHNLLCLLKNNFHILNSK